MEQLFDETTPLAPQEENPVQQQPEQPVYQAPPVPEQPVYQAPPMPEQPVYQAPPMPEQPVYQTPPMPEQPMYGQPMYQQPYEPAPKKKNVWKIVLPIAIVVLLAAAVAVYFLFFNGTPIDEIELEDTSLTMEIGDKYDLDYEVLPEDATELKLTWESDDTSVATVKDGKVVAVAEGTCTITVTAESGAKDACKITVNPPMSEEDARLLGRWEVQATYFDGDLVPFSDSSTYMVLYDDMTGVFYIGDSTYVITEWGYKKSTDSSDLYNVEMEGMSPSGFGYVTDTSSSLYGKLLFILDSDNTIILER